MKTIPHVSAFALLFCAALASAPAARANNLRVGGIRLNNVDKAAGTADILVNVAWDNAWRGVWDGVDQWDAVWLFAKVRAPGGVWTHAWLSPASSAPAGGALDVGTTPVNGVDRGVGAFLYAGSETAGGVEYDGVRLRWQYAAQGFTLRDDSTVEVSVMGVEMVHCAAGAFWAGNAGGVTNNSFRAAADETAPVRVADEGALTLCYGAGADPASYDLPAAFPKGVNGFYCMKYMITQGQWADFLNLLTRSQQERVCSAKSAGMYMCADNPSAKTTPQVWNYVHVADEGDGSSPRVYEATSPDVCCNWISWDDGALWASWAGLRPMTELEFEKVCRGPFAPVANEYVWGDTYLKQPQYLANKPMTGRETDNFWGNAAIAGNFGYLQRAGIFASEDATHPRDRSASGAAYFGAMEMGSVLNDLVVSAHDAKGRAFAGTHGAGGWGVPSDWPATTWWQNAPGIGRRGGNWYNQKEDAMLASRRTSLTGGSRLNTTGFRAVRTDP